MLIKNRLNCITITSCKEFVTGNICSNCDTENSITRKLACKILSFRIIISFRGFGRLCIRRSFLRKIIRVILPIGCGTPISSKCFFKIRYKIFIHKIIYWYHSSSTPRASLRPRKDNIFALYICNCSTSRIILCCRGSLHSRIFYCRSISILLRSKFLRFFARQKITEPI